MSKAADRGSILRGCMYASDVGPGDYMYTLEVDPMPDVDGADMSRTTGMP